MGNVAHAGWPVGYPVLPVVSYCVVCHVLYRFDCDRLHPAVRFSAPPPSYPPFPSLAAVVIKYISSTDKCKMDDPPQLQRSWRLRYGKSAGCHRGLPCDINFLAARKCRIGSRMGKPIEAEYTIPSHKAGCAPRVCVCVCMKGAFC